METTKTESCSGAPTHLNTIDDNDLSMNGLRGLHLFNESTSNTIRGNSCYCNTLLGIAIYKQSSNNSVQENTTFGNVYGIGLLHEAPGNTIVNNESFDNEGCGLYLESAADNTFEGKLAKENGRCGLAVLPPVPGEGPDPRDNAFSSNRFVNNGSYGAVIASELVPTNCLITSLSGTAWKTSSLLKGASSATSVTTLGPSRRPAAVPEVATVGVLEGDDRPVQSDRRRDEHRAFTELSGDHNPLRSSVVSPAAMGVLAHPAVFSVREKTTLRAAFMTPWIG